MESTRAAAESVRYVRRTAARRRLEFDRIAFVPAAKSDQKILTIIGYLPEDNSKYRTKHANQDTPETARERELVKGGDCKRRLDKVGRGPFAAGTNPTYGR